MATKVKYKYGYVLARRWKRKPKEVPKDDTILLRLRGKHARIDTYIRPDEAVAIILVLASEVWEELIEKGFEGKCENVKAWAVQSPRKPCTLYGRFNRRKSLAVKVLKM